ncbi:MAG: hypothetical protein KatS3mg129_0203 [Leptospiraceae bacterium]|nr:MAG: hypothetical protein KatS3mg129_0203 [Leptospiraceae bacterium]
MLFTSHFKKLLFCFIGIIIIIEIVVRIFPIYYFEKPEKFLITYIRNKIESGKNNYDIIILGDSRSMSLNPGKYKNVYNFSMPAMGSRYYPYFVKKYLKYNKKPKAIIFAGSPVLVYSGKGDPVIHPSLKRYVYPDMTLLEYLYERSIKRVLNIKQEIYWQDYYKREELVWEFFSHRLLFLFSTYELAHQYIGVERIFVLSQSIPLNYITYKHRDAIKNLFEIDNYKTFENYIGTSKCTCENILKPYCQPPKSQYQDNKIVEKNLIKNNGYLNISDRLPPKLISLYEKQKEITIENYKKGFNSIPKFDFSYTIHFINYLNENNIIYIYLFVPFPEYFQQSKEILTFEQEFQKVLKQFPTTKMFYFPNKFLDPDLYSDQVHLNCKGAEKLNYEFQNIVLPQIINYVETYYKSSK